MEENKFKYSLPDHDYYDNGRLHNLVVDDERFPNEPITHGLLVMLGFKHHVGGYYCPPYIPGGNDYRLEYEATQFQGGKPIKGTEEWRAYLTNTDLSTIRRFKTIGELRDFHKGMGGGMLF